MHCWCASHTRNQSYVQSLFKLLISSITSRCRQSTTEARTTTVEGSYADADALHCAGSQ